MPALHRAFDLSEIQGARIAFDFAMAAVAVIDLGPGGAVRLLPASSSAASLRFRGACRTSKNISPARRSRATLQEAAKQALTKTPQPLAEHHKVPLARRPHQTRPHKTKRLKNASCVFVHFRPSWLCSPWLRL